MAKKHSTKTMLQKILGLLEGQSDKAKELNRKAKTKATKKKRKKSKKKG